MSKGFIPFLLLFLLSTVSEAQDDYVISKPTETGNKLIDSIPNPDYTSYLLNSSSYTLKKGNIRVLGTDIIYGKFSYGLTDNTMGSISISLLGTFIGSVKQQIRISDDIKLGISGSIGQLAHLPSNLSTDSTVFFTGAQAMVTFGDLQNNLTVGTGHYYIKSSFNLINEEREFLSNNFYFGIQKQLRRKVYLIAEGIYFLYYNVVSGSGGFKFIIKKHMTLGIGVMPVAWIDRSVSRPRTEAGAIPIISFRILLD